MRTSTLSHAFAAGHLATDAPVSRTTSSKRPQGSFWKRFVDGLIAGQELRARRIVWAHLAHKDDATLARLGWTDADVAALRQSQNR